MTDREKLRQVLLGENFTVGEKAVVMWQMGLLGSFNKALWEAIARADEENLMKLSFGFPDEVMGYRAWSHGDLAKRLRAAGLEI